MKAPEPSRSAAIRVPQSIPLLVGAALLLACSVLAQAQSVAADDAATVVVDGQMKGEIVSFGKTVIIKSEVKNALVFGGDLVVEGRVDEDVATVGGSVIQKESGFIGGDVFALGGSYRSEGLSPQRNPGRETLVYAGYEKEIREMVLNPSSILAPSVSWSFLIQRLFSLFFWFVLAIGINTISPGAVGRAVSSFQLTPLKTFSLGISGFMVLSVGMVLALSFLPTYLSTVAGLMVLALILVSYIFGRVALQVALGKLLQKRFLPESKRSETLAVLLGVLVVTVLLSVPYLWTVAMVALLAASIGLVVDGGSGRRWRNARP